MGPYLHGVFPVFTLNNMVQLFKKYCSYRHLVIKPQEEKVLQINTMESETPLWVYF